MNKTRTPIVSRALLISLLALAVLSFAGASGAGPLALIVSSDDPPVVVEDECPEEGDEATEEDPDGTEGEDTEGEDTEGEDTEGEDTEGEDPEGEDPEECEPDDGSGEDSDEPEDEVVESPEGDAEAREAECSEAAGLEDGATVEETYGDVDAPYGQKHSTEVLLVNCMKNPQAKGLLRALENHARHLERWEARAELRAERDAAKAERKAARDAAKAERKAARDAAKAERKAARDAAKAASGHGGGKGKGHH
jgi:hypothetical protein